MIISILVFLVPLIPQLSSIFLARLNTVTNEYYQRDEGNGHDRYVDTVYTEIEKNALRKFRPMVEDVLENKYERMEQFLIRWIHVCNFDLDVANNMLRKVKQWRKANKMDTILEEAHLPQLGDFCSFNGIAYDGRPVVVINSGTHYDVRKLVIKGHRGNITRKMLQCFEKSAILLRNMTEDTGRDISSTITIMDMGPYSINQHACSSCFSMYLNFIRNAQYIYPEYGKLFIFINVPTIVKPLMELVKSVANSRTLDLIRMFGTEKKEWSSFLLKYIPPDQLSHNLGGTAPW